ncbi:Rad4-domain-containing protein [Linnemannia elongata AG-77]|uniref:Rad4-domain-containing protein n=1 Tax=Linnemannia elongata AG-77 TaxID=1314771 RepID=A0A197K4Z1_9FUNG|nr:Rad4-domain-containing protein [Linnemannia elongata AG-77]
MSEDDSDFQNSSTSGPSIVEGSTGKAAGSKRSALGKTIPVKPKKQKQEEKGDLLAVDDGAIGMDQENDEKQQESGHDAEESDLDDVGDPEFNPDYYSSDDDQEWVEVPVPEVLPQQEAATDEYYEEEELSGPWQYNAVEIVFDKPPEDVKKTPGRGITKEERMIRVLIHQTHLLCLIANGLCRNRWINSPKMHTVALSLVPEHIASSVQKVHDNPVREVNALQVLALWWKDSFVVTGPGIESVPYADIDVVGVEAAMPANRGESFKKRKNLQRRLLNRNGSSDVCSQLFTAICRSLGLKARLVESLQACTFKVTLPKDETVKSGAEASKSTTGSSKKGKKKKEVVLDESDTTRGSRQVISTPHRLAKRPKLPPHNKLADPPVFWTEIYAEVNQKWITIDPVRGVVNCPLKMHPAASCTTNNLAYVVAYDEDNYVTDVTRRYTSQWTTVTKKLRVQPAGPAGFDWWAQTMAVLTNPSPSVEEDIEEAELQQAEASERMPTKLGDFNNHPIYALERHLKKFEVLHPKLPVLGHIRGEAIYPRSCVKQVRSKENWLKRARQIKSGEVIPIKWIKSRPATIFQMRLQQQAALAGGNKMETDDDQGEASGENGDQVALFGEWQTEPYQPPWVVDGRVPRNDYGRQDVFTPDMVPIGGTHLKGRGIGRVARQLGVDFVEAVTGFEFQSRRSVPIIQGIIVPTESAELVMDAYREVTHHADQEALKKKRAEVLRRWRKLIKGVVLRSRLMEEYGEDMAVDEDDERDNWVPPEDDDDDDEVGRPQDVSSSPTTDDVGRAAGKRRLVGAGSEGEGEEPEDRSEPTQAHVEADSGGGFMFD